MINNFCSYTYINFLFVGEIESAVSILWQIYFYNIFSSVSEKPKRLDIERHFMKQKEAQRYC